MGQGAYNNNINNNIIYYIMFNNCNPNTNGEHKFFMDIKNNEQHEDIYNSMCMHTFFIGDESETIKIKSRMAKTTCIVREKDALVPS